ncbi:MAG: hypothetical protein NC418_00620 [Muribaculaceae bacterium]|nr:hypothetical protein [Muribaculaceae bacterium]
MKLKNLMLAGALALAPAMSAQTYAVWPAATDGEIQIPVEYNHWYNNTPTVIEDGAVSVYKWTQTDSGRNEFSAGLMMNSQFNTFDFAQIADLDLVFEAKIEGPGNWVVRLTAPDNDKKLAIPTDGEFHTIRYNIKRDFPDVYTTWSTGAADGQNIFPFALVGSNLAVESAIYFTNVRYEDAVAKPEVEAVVSDITTNSAKLAYKVTFPEGYENTSVTINGTAADDVATLDLTGLDANTAYTYTILAKGEINGETYTAEEVVTFRTLREAGDNPVWHGVTDKDGFTAEYSITYNLDKTLTVDATIETQLETPQADRNFHIYIGGNEWLKLADQGNNFHTGTTTSTFEEGSQITWEWYLPYSGGVYQETNTYIIGSENEAPLAIRVKASAENVTSESAEVAYTVTCPGDYKVYYRLGDGEAIEAASSPIALSGLSEKTEYSCELWAVTAGDEPVESKHVTVTFKTPAANAVDLVYSDLFAAEVKNAYLPGEDASMARSFFATLPWSVVYKADGTAVYSIDLSAIEGIVGFVPQIYWNGFQNLVKNNESGRYEYNFGAQEADAEVAISHYIAYAGGVVDSRTPYTHWGMEKETPELGEAERLELALSNEFPKINQPVVLTAKLMDANGYYLPSDAVEFISTNSNVTIDGVVARVINEKGLYRITASYGALEAVAHVRCVAGEESENMIAGKAGVTNEANIQAGSVANVTDADRNSQLEWRCADTEEHYLVFDLGEGDGYYIEAVEVYFEGAFATEFTVTLSSAAPAELGAAAGRAAATEDVVFTPEQVGVQHFFTQDPTEQHRYVTLRTSKALNAGWGIKLRDMKVYASESLPSHTTTGVENVAAADADAPAEYYTLGGVRVLNPTPGLYICRRGAKVSKVFVK